MLLYLYSLIHLKDLVQVKYGSSMIQVRLSTRWDVEPPWWAEPLPQDVSDPVQVLGTSKDLVQALENKLEPKVDKVVSAFDSFDT